MPEAFDDFAGALQDASMGALSQGATITYEPAGGTPVPGLDAIVRAWTVEDTAFPGEISASGPLFVVCVREEDLGLEPAQDDTILVGLPVFAADRRYTVAELESDGRGWWRLKCKRAKDPV